MPNISFIVTTRNDNHGGDLLKRTSTFVNGLIYQCSKFQLVAELVIVEWNPPADKPLLKEVLPSPPKGCPLVIRYIIVPEELHKTFRFQDNIPLYQMIAKNVGIRRAKFDWILCTNIDLLFSDDLIRYLKNEDLQISSFYRANRVDVPKEIMDIPEYEAKIDFGERNIIARHGISSNSKYINVPLPSFVWGFPRVIKLIDYFFGVINKKKYYYYGLDFNACGDFTLMHRKSWELIEGYVEIDLYSLHIDSMALISAKSLGLNQCCLQPAFCTYHIHHEEGWSGFKNPVDMVRFLVKRPSLDWFTVGEAGKHLFENGKNWDLNPSTWGFSDKVFEEYEILPPQ